MSLPSGQAPVVSDLDLIGRIKAQNDSAAVSELVHRHTGIYISVIQQYEGYSDFRARANVPDLKDDKFINIYQFALKYDPTRATESGKPMQFGSYVGQMTKFMCKKLISMGSESIELNEATAPTNDTSVTDTAERDSALESIHAQVEAIDEGLPGEIAKVEAQIAQLTAAKHALEEDLLSRRVFKEIFNLRYSGKTPMVWRDVAKKVNMTHEGARKAFNKHMELIKERARD